MIYHPGTRRIFNLLRKRNRKLRRRPSLRSLGPLQRERDSVIEAEKRPAREMPERCGGLACARLFQGKVLQSW